MSAPFPARGDTPWDTVLQAYIDEVATDAATALADEASSRNNQISTLGGVIADQGEVIAAHDTRLTTLENGQTAEVVMIEQGDADPNPSGYSNGTLLIRKAV